MGAVRTRTRMCGYFDPARRKDQPMMCKDSQIPYHRPHAAPSMDLSRGAAR